MDSHLHTYLLCYDIAHPRRLKRVHRQVRDWGIPIQYSVFEITLSPQQLPELLQQLKTLIDEQEDKIQLYRINPQKKCIHLGATVNYNQMLFY